MKKSQFESIIREVLRETIRKVDGKYVVYPQKGGKRLGTHSTKKAAEKQLTAIHLNKEAVEPNFDFEWGEAARYPEFKKLGKDKWIELAKTGKAIEITSAEDINNTDANEPDAFKTLDPNKQKRALAQLKSSNVEMPIVALYSDGYKELVAGNTRLTAMIAQNKKATIWQFEVPEEILDEGFVLQDLEDKFDIDLDLHDDGKALTLSRIVIPKGKRGKGIGSKVMNLIIQYADAQNKPIYLTPSKDFGATSTGRLEQFYKQFGFKKKDKSDFSTRETMVREPQTSENYADGKVKGKSRPGRVKRAGASCKGSVTDLRAKAKKYGGEKGKMYHWCANMKSGRKKK